MKNEIISLAKELIAIPSVSGDIQQSIAVLERAKKQLKNFEFTAFASNNIPSLLYSNQGLDRTHFKIMLNAHLDVVPASQEQFNPIEKNGKLYGRGAYDMKGAAAVMILLFHELGHLLAYPLGLQIVVDEEFGGGNSTKFQIDQGIRAHFVIAGEGSNLRIVHGAKSSTKLRLVATGKASHGAYPWLGENAILKLQRVLERIIQHFPIPEKESFEPTVNITHISTNNTVFNKTPDHCEAILDIRSFGQDDRIIKQIESLLEEGVSIEQVRAFPAHFSDPNNIYIQKLQLSAHKTIKDTLQLAKTHGASDVCFYTAVGCDGVEFGPKGGNHHGENEWVDIQSLKDYYAILKHFLLSVEEKQSEVTVNESATGVIEEPLYQEQEE